MANWIERLQERWQVKTTRQVLTILLVFALTGFSAMYIKKPIFEALGVSPTDHWAKRTGIWLLTVFPIYNILLLCYGFLLGQFAFFWRFEKRFFGRLIGKKVA